MAARTNNPKVYKSEKILLGGPNVFLYEDYRVFLREVYDHLKATRRGFSLRLFSKMAGLNSSNYLKLVMDNERNLTNKSIAKFGNALQLNPAESEFFEALVHFTQAQDTKAKAFQYDRMKKCRGYLNVKGVDRDQFDVFSQWYNIAIRELVTLSDFEESAEWISQRVLPNISESQAVKALQLLLKLGMLKKENGKIIQSESMLATSPEMKSLAVRNLHRQILIRASHLLDEVSVDERDISVLTLGINKSHMELVKRRILEFRRSLLLEIGQSKEELEEVYQLSVQFLPLTQKVQKKRKEKK